MERELESRIFMFEDYKNGDIKEDIKKYIKELNNKFPSAIVTNEFYRGKGIIVRATEINSKVNRK